MNSLWELKENISELEKRINYFFKDKECLVLAFIHKSFVNENKKIVDEHNERLEFLGDAVLDLLAARYLFFKYPDVSEGILSSYRSQIVDSHSCEKYVKKLNIEEFLLLGKGELQTEDRGRSSILANLFEAVIGAIYLDGGMDEAQKFFDNQLPEIEDFLKNPHSNYKADLQELCQKKYFETPRYEVVGESGPEHLKTFEVKVFIKEIELGEGTGFSKKQAEMAAAKDAIEKKENNFL